MFKESRLGTCRSTPRCFWRDPSNCWGLTENRPADFSKSQTDATPVSLMNKITHAIASDLNEKDAVEGGRSDSPSRPRYRWLWWAASIRFWCQVGNLEATEDFSTTFLAPAGWELQTHPSTCVSSHFTTENSAHITQSILLHLVAALLLVNFFFFFNR